ncbi:MAG: PDZ domain-containing protein, partial [Planctomycetaceae bacterium]
EIADSEVRLVRSQTQSGLTDLSPETLEGVLAGQESRSRRVILGVMPGLSDEGKGLVIQSIVPLSPAARYGLRVGDIILQVDEQTVATTRQLTERIRIHERGETTVLQIRRNGILLELNVKL